MSDLMSTPQTIDSRLDELFARLEEKKAIQYYVLAVITLLAAVLRFYKLGEWSFWIDEIFTISRAQVHFSDTMFFLRNLPSTLWMPLSVIFTEVSLKTFGVAEWSARLTSSVIGILSIPILFFTSRKFTGPGAALILALLLAISPWHLFWSQNARYYTSILLIYTLAAFAFFYAIERDRPLYILVFYVLFYFAISERLTAAFIIPVVFAYLIALYIFFKDRPPGLNKRNILLLITPIVGFVILDLFRLNLSNSSIVVDVIEVFVKYPSYLPLVLLAHILYNISLPIIFLAFISGLNLIRRKSRIGIFFILSATIPVILLVLFSTFMVTQYGYVFMTLPFWFLLVGLAITDLSSRTDITRKLLTLSILVILILNSSSNLLFYYGVNHGNRSNWKAAFEIVKERSVDSDVIVARWSEFGPIYLGKELRESKDITPESVVESGKRYWFVADMATSFNNIILLNWLNKNAQLEEVLYLRTPESEKSLKIYLYDPALHPPVAGARTGE
jgi:mannosyltransferase